MKSRRAAREKAFQILYSADVVEREWEEEKVRTIENSLSLVPEGKEKEYLLDVVNGVLSCKKEIDRLISKASEHWKMERMSAVDRNILRVAVYEMLYRGDIPVKVSITEAVELAKKFGGTDSPSFVNGVLDGIAKILKGFDE